MPRFSAFSRFSHLRFSSQPTDAQRIYEDMVSNQGSGKNFSDDFDSVNAGRLYANSMAFARAKLTTERAGNQFRPTKAVEMLPSLEWEFGITPGATQTIRQRQTAVAAAAKIAIGARYENVVDVLTALLGSDFRAYLTIPVVDAVDSTSNPGFDGNYVPPGTIATVGRILEDLVPGGATTVLCEILNDGPALFAGQRVAFDVPIRSRSEWQILAAVTSIDMTLSPTLPHAAGTFFTTGRTATLSSTKRQNLVVLSAAAAANPEKIRVTNEALRKLLRGVSTWSICGENPTPRTAGPFKVGPGVGSGLLNFTPIGSVSF